ncbi:aldo/keto reductase [Indiicoccus explosivorum]|uniref:aldo/keto reductase n=1 Tax=Indiicoccus explosivorum TaxID=1917864 RepID=UPI000B4376FC|nr:aldo/keto reductase [Indiicoccus explosivorum]
MKYTVLKKTDIRISAIGLGTNAVGGHNLYDGLEEKDGREMVRTAIGHGVTFFDTADSYGHGRSEELVGEALKDYGRSQYVLATKGGSDWRTKTKNISPAYLKKALDDSLSRLGLEYVDLYYLHHMDKTTPVGEAVAELVRQKEAGKIRAIGVSNVTLDELKEANAHGDVNAVQLAYHMLDRSIEKEILPYCVENDISIVAYGPLAFGLLGGTYSSDFRLAPGDFRNRLPLFQHGTFERAIGTAEALKKVASEKGTTLPNLALAWLLAQPGVDAVIPGGKRPEQVTGNIPAADLVLTEEDLAKIAVILD